MAKNYSHMRNQLWLVQYQKNMESFVQMAVKMDSCVAEELFYKKLESMKSSTQGKASNLTVYLSDEFYDKAKA